MEVKNKSLVSIFVLGFLTLLLATPRPASAFWLFDMLSGGQVKGDQTSVGSLTPSGVSGIFESFVRRFAGQNLPTQLPVASGAPADSSLRTNTAPPPLPSTMPSTTSGQPNPEQTLDRLVTSGKLTAAQAAELKAKLAAIKAKREELTALEKDLAAWLKANNIGPTSSNGGVRTPLNK